LPIVGGMGEGAVTGEPGWELRALSLAYAEAADRRDVAGFLAVFAPDGVVEVYRPLRGDEPTGVFRGHGELARIPASLARWPSTAHLVGDAAYRWEADGEASGVVACEAHHVRPADGTGGTTDEVMTIRYHDRYRRADGRWLIAHRQVRVVSVRTEAAGGGSTP
jgi:ketosteroid isomerase-like protein